MVKQAGLLYCIEEAREKKQQLQHTHLISHEGREREGKREVNTPNEDHSFPLSHSWPEQVSQKIEIRIAYKPADMNRGNIQLSLCITVHHKYISYSHFCTIDECYPYLIACASRYISKHKVYTQIIYTDNQPLLWRRFTFYITVVSIRNAKNLKQDQKTFK